jgi:hypothetical protein
MKSTAAANNDASAAAIARGDAVGATACSDQTTLLTPGSEPSPNAPSQGASGGGIDAARTQDRVAKEEDQ